MIFLKSEYTTVPLLYLPRVEYGETVGRDFFQARIRDMVAKKNFRQLETVSFDLSLISAEKSKQLKKFLNETQGYAVQLDFIPHMIRFRGIITEANFQAGKHILPNNAVPIDEEGNWGIISGTDTIEITPVIPEIEYNCSIVLIAPEYIELTEQMLINDFEEAGLEYDPSGTVGGGGLGGFG